MKQVLIVLVTFAMLFNCKNKKEDIKITQEPSSTEKMATEANGLTLLKGEFIYYADAAVLETPTEIYGVVIDEKMHELDKQVQPYKKLPTDMVPVEIKGKIVPKPDNEEGWPFRVEIKEIVKVSKPNLEDNNVVTLGK
jgi:hypothetical protein